MPILETALEFLFVSVPYICLGFILVLLFRVIKKKEYGFLSKQVLIPILALIFLFWLLFLFAPEHFFNGLVITLYLIFLYGAVKEIRDKNYGWALMWLIFLIALGGYYLFALALARTEILIPAWILGITIFTLLPYGITKEIKDGSYWMFIWGIVLIVLGGYLLTELVAPSMPILVF